MAIMLRTKYAWVCVVPLSPQGLSFPHSPVLLKRWEGRLRLMCHQYRYTRVACATGEYKRLESIFPILGAGKLSPTSVHSSQGSAQHIFASDGSSPD